ncbi:MAG: serpin family protein, partial [Myxococcota bacterium]
PTFRANIRFGVALGDANASALGFDKAELDEALSELEPVLLDISLPKFKAELGDSNIKDDLGEMGLQAFFDDANLSGLTDSLGGYTIDAVVHKTVLDVSEEGFEGAAATGISVGETSIPEFVEVDMDRPFVYWVRDVTTGAYIFLGTFEAPAP